MSDHIHYNPARFLSYETRKKLRKLGISTDDYASNICNTLRSRGEYRLAERINLEIDESLEEYRWDEARKKALEFYPQYDDYREVPDSLAAPFLGPAYRKSYE